MDPYGQVHFNEMVNNVNGVHAAVDALPEMQEARAMALRSQRITDQAPNLNAEQTAEINRNAIEITRLLTE